MKTIFLYTSANCSLCDRFLLLLKTSQRQNAFLIRQLELKSDDDEFVKTPFIRFENGQELSFNAFEDSVFNEWIQEKKPL